MYSRASRYAMRALAYMATRPANSPVHIRAIGKSAKVPPSYTAKIFQGLVRAGVVSSRRGPSGGYLLTRDPASITLLDVMNAVDDVNNSPLSSCIMGLDRCSDENACPLHDIWVQAAERMKCQLQESTVKDLAGLTRRLRPFEKSRRVLSPDIRAVFE